MTLRLTSAAFPALLLVALPAHALEDLGECLAAVEAYHHALVEEDIPETWSADLEHTLGRAVSACEDGDLARGAGHLEVAKAQYEALFEGEDAGLGGVTDADFWVLADTMWGNRSYGKGVDYMQFDMTGDGDGDYIGYFENQDNPDGPSFQMLVVSKPAGEETVKYGFVSLPYNDGSQFSLCNLEEAPEPTALRHRQFSPEEVAALEIPVSRQGAEIDDGMCDTIRVLWPVGMAGELVEGMGMRVPLVLDRN
ncbi:hypothetical protein [Amaricoccus macauensis]|uniref:hypothetical protein n=1 Tax=Amaricoccus macauensis TaxID=57001 RepID=UPI003C7E720F